MHAKTQAECYHYLFEAAVRMAQLGFDASARAAAGAAAAPDRRGRRREMKAHWLDRAGDDQHAGARRATTCTTRSSPPTRRATQRRSTELKRERGYIEQDVVALAPSTPNLDTICAKFVDEHYHDDDEVRFVLEGEGIFDIRSRDDRWMRVVVERGDLIVVPKDRHHRFMLTEQQDHPLRAPVQGRERLDAPLPRLT